jgi:hypothetical protein
VASLLVDLKKDTSTSIRVSFPDSVDKKIVRFPEARREGDTEAKVMRFEQREIRDFLCANQGKPLAEIKDALIARTAKSASFSAFRIENGFISAEQWVEQFFKGTDPNSEKKLSVKKVISIAAGEDPAQKLANPDIQASLRDSASKKIPVVFEAPTTTDAAQLQTLAQALSSTHPFLGATGFDTARLWLMPAEHVKNYYNDKSPLPDLSNTKIEVYRLDEFVGKNVGSGKGTPPPQGPDVSRIPNLDDNGPDRDDQDEGDAKQKREQLESELEKAREERRKKREEERNGAFWSGTKEAFEGINLPAISEDLILDGERIAESANSDGTASARKETHAPVAREHSTPAKRSAWRFWQK